MNEAVTLRLGLDSRDFEVGLKKAQGQFASFIGNNLSDFRIDVELGKVQDNRFRQSIFQSAKEAAKLAQEQFLRIRLPELELNFSSGKGLERIQEDVKNLSASIDILKGKGKAFSAENIFTFGDRNEQSLERQINQYLKKIESANKKIEALEKRRDTATGRVGDSGLKKYNDQIERETNRLQGLVQQYESKIDKLNQVIAKRTETKGGPTPTQASNLDTLTSQLLSAKSELNNFQEKINSIDASSLATQLASIFNATGTNTIDTALAELENRLKSVSNQIEETAGKKIELASAPSDSEEFDNSQLERLNEQSKAYEDLANQIQKTKAKLQSIKEVIPEDIQGNITNAAVEELNLDKIVGEINTAKIALASFQEEVDQTRENLEKVRQLGDTFSQIGKFGVGLGSTFEQVRRQLQEVDALLNSIERTSGNQDQINNAYLARGRILKALTSDTYDYLRAEQQLAEATSDPGGATAGGIDLAFRTRTAEILSKEFGDLDKINEFARTPAQLKAVVAEINSSLENIDLENPFRKPLQDAKNNVNLLIEYLNPAGVRAAAAEVGESLLSAFDTVELANKELASSGIISIDRFEQDNKRLNEWLDLNEKTFADLSKSEKAWLSNFEATLKAREAAAKEGNAKVQEIFENFINDPPRGGFSNDPSRENRAIGEFLDEFSRGSKEAEAKANNFIDSISGNSLEEFEKNLRDVVARFGEGENAIKAAERALRTLFSTASARPELNAISSVIDEIANRGTGGPLAVNDEAFRASQVRSEQIESARKANAPFARIAQEEQKIVSESERLAAEGENFFRDRLAQSQDAIERKREQDRKAIEDKAKEVEAIKRVEAANSEAARRETALRQEKLAKQREITSGYNDELASINAINAALRDSQQNLNAKPRRTGSFDEAALKNFAQQLKAIDAEFDVAASQSKQLVPEEAIERAKRLQQEASDIPSLVSLAVKEIRLLAGGFSASSATAEELNKILDQIQKKADSTKINIFDRSSLSNLNDYSKRINQLNEELGGEEIGSNRFKQLAKEIAFIDLDRQDRAGAKFKGLAQGAEEYARTLSETLDAQEIFNRVVSDFGTSREALSPDQANAAASKLKAISNALPADVFGDTQRSKLNELISSLTKAEKAGVSAADKTNEKLKAVLASYQAIDKVIRGQIVSQNELSNAIKKTNDLFNKATPGTDDFSRAALQQIRNQIAQTEIESAKAKAISDQLINGPVAGDNSEALKADLADILPDQSEFKNIGERAEEALRQGLSGRLSSPIEEEVARAREAFKKGLNSIADQQLKLQEPTGFSEEEIRRATVTPKRGVSEDIAQTIASESASILGNREAVGQIKNKILSDDRYLQRRDLLGRDLADSLDDQLARGRAGANLKLPEQNLERLQSAIREFYGLVDQGANVRLDTDNASTKINQLDVDIKQIQSNASKPIVLKIEDFGRLSEFISEINSSVNDRQSAIDNKARGVAFRDIKFLNEDPNRDGFDPSDADIKNLENLTRQSGGKSLDLVKLLGGREKLDEAIKASIEGNFDNELFKKAKAALQEFYGILGNPPSVEIGDEIADVKDQIDNLASEASEPIEVQLKTEESKKAIQDLASEAENLQKLSSVDQPEIQPEVEVQVVEPQKLEEVETDLREFYNLTDQKPEVDVNTAKLEQDKTEIRETREELEKLRAAQAAVETTAIPETVQPEIQETRRSTSPPPPSPPLDESQLRQLDFDIFKGFSLDEAIKKSLKGPIERVNVSEFTTPLLPAETDGQQVEQGYRQQVIALKQQIDLLRQKSQILADQLQIEAKIIASQNALTKQILPANARLEREAAIANANARFDFPFPRSERPNRILTGIEEVEPRFLPPARPSPGVQTGESTTTPATIFSGRQLRDLRKVFTQKLIEPGIEPVRVADITEAIKRSEQTRQSLKQPALPPAAAPEVRPIFEIDTSEFEFLKNANEKTRETEGRASLATQLEESFGSLRSVVDNFGQEVREGAAAVDTFSKKVKADVPEVPPASTEFKLVNLEKILSQMAQASDRPDVAERILKALPQELVTTDLAGVASDQRVKRESGVSTDDLLLAELKSLAKEAGIAVGPIDQLGQLFKKLATEAVGTIGKLGNVFKGQAASKATADVDTSGLGQDQSEIRQTREEIEELQSSKATAKVDVDTSGLDKDQTEIRQTREELEALQAAQAAFRGVPPRVTAPAPAEPPPISADDLRAAQSAFGGTRPPQPPTPPASPGGGDNGPLDRFNAIFDRDIESNIPRVIKGLISQSANLLDNIEAGTKEAVRLGSQLQQAEEKLKSLQVPRPTKPLNTKQGKAESEVITATEELRKAQEAVAKEVPDTQAYNQAVDNVIQKTQALSTAQGKATQIQSELSEAFLASVTRTQTLDQYLASLRGSFGESAQGAERFVSALQELVLTLPRTSKFLPELEASLKKSQTNLINLQNQASPDFTTFKEFREDIGRILTGGGEVGGKGAFGIPQRIKESSPGTQRALNELLIGGGFPLLFGQGIGAAAGGGIGGLFGGLISQGGGFAGGIVGTAIGQALTDAGKAAEDLGVALRSPIQNLEKLKELQLLPSRTEEARATGEIARGRRLQALSTITSGIAETSPEALTFQKDLDKITDPIFRDSGRKVRKVQADLGNLINLAIAGTVGAIADEGPTVLGRATGFLFTKEIVALFNTFRKIGPKNIVSDAEKGAQIEQERLDSRIKQTEEAASIPASLASSKRAAEINLENKKIQDQVANLKTEKEQQKDAAERERIEQEILKIIDEQNIARAEQLGQAKALNAEAEIQLQKQTKLAGLSLNLPIGAREIIGNAFSEDLAISSALEEFEKASANAKEIENRIAIEQKALSQIPARDKKRIEAQKNKIDELQIQLSIENQITQETEAQRKNIEAQRLARITSAKLALNQSQIELKQLQDTAGLTGAELEIATEKNAFDVLEKQYDELQKQIRRNPLNTELQIQEEILQTEIDKARLALADNIYKAFVDATNRGTEFIQSKLADIQLSIRSDTADKNLESAQRQFELSGSPNPEVSISIEKQRNALSQQISSLKSGLVEAFSAAAKLANDAKNASEAAELSRRLSPDGKGDQNTIAAAARAQEAAARAGAEVEIAGKNFKAFVLESAAGFELAIQSAVKQLGGSLNTLGASVLDTVINANNPAFGVFGSTGLDIARQSIDESYELAKERYKNAFGRDPLGASKTFDNISSNNPDFLKAKSGFAQQIDQLAGQKEQVDALKETIAANKALKEEILNQISATDRLTKALGAFVPGSTEPAEIDIVNPEDLKYQKLSDDRFSNQRSRPSQLNEGFSISSPGVTQQPINSLSQLFRFIDTNRASITGGSVSPKTTFSSEVQTNQVIKDQSDLGNLNQLQSAISNNTGGIIALAKETTTLAGQIKNLVEKDWTVNVVVDGRQQPPPKLG